MWGYITEPLAWTLALIATTALCALPASAAEPAKDCKLKEYASFAVAYSTKGHPAIAVVIDNHPVRMWFNTASAFSGIDQQDVEQLGLKAHSLPAGMPAAHWGKELITAYVTIRRLTLGNMELRGAEMFVLPTEPVSKNGEWPMDGAPVGYLGMDVMSNVDVELDLGHDKINFFSRDHCSGAAVYWADQFAVVPMRRDQFRNLYFVMQLDGKKLQTTLATGDPSSTLGTNVTRRLYGWDESSPGERVMSLSAVGLQVLNAEISLKSFTGECANVVIDSDGAAGYEGCVSVYPLHLGMSVLKKLRIYLSTREQKIYLTAADAHKQTTTQSVK